MKILKNEKITIETCFEYPDLVDWFTINLARSLKGINKYNILDYFSHGDLYKYDLLNLLKISSRIFNYINMIKIDIFEYDSIKCYRSLLDNKKEELIDYIFQNVIYYLQGIYIIYKYLKSANFKFSSDCLQFGENMYQGSLKCAIALAILMEKLPGCT